MQALSQRTTWVFDLDNTLYPYESNLFAQVSDNMGYFIMELLNVDRQTAHSYQKEYLKDYGTTLAGLIKHHDVNPDEFLDFVHDIDYTRLVKCDALCDSLERIGGDKYVFTNGTKKHAESVLQQLGITNKFDGLFGVEDCDYIPKPHKKPYDIFIKQFNIDPHKSVFVEDTAKNLEVPKDKGFKTVLIETDCVYANEKFDKPFIDYKCKNISEFLYKIDF